MAETGFNPTPVSPVSSVDNRDVFAERPREDGKRVQPIQRSDESATSHERSEERAAEIERLAGDALKNSKLRILRDREKDEYVYLMIDSDTGETVRRWPPENHKDLMEYLRTRTAGLLDQKA